MKPYSDDVINVMIVKGNRSSKLGKKGDFVDSEIECSIGRSRWSTHCGSSKLDSVVLHENFQPLNDGTGATTVVAPMKVSWKGC